MRKSLCKFAVITMAVICTTISAAPYTPKTADEIVAHWPLLDKNILPKATAGNHLQRQDSATIVALANRYMAQAAQPGQSRFYGLAQAVLKPLIENNSQDKNVWLVWAQVQQHQHNFSVAQLALQKVLQQDPANISANLLAARIHVILESPLAARNACLKLLGSADLFTVTACSLEANTYLNPNELDSSYKQLVQLVHAQGLPNDERGTWLIQVLADMAMRNQDPATAASWLRQRLENSSVNYLAQWADVELAMNHAPQVLSYLTGIVNNAPEMDDALLLRLALSEKKINSTSHLWEKLLSERVALREQRQDTLHANELATYYLDINPNPEKALRWATLNFASAREYGDKKLLARAELLNAKKDNN